MQFRTVSSISGVAGCLGLMLMTSVGWAASTIDAWDLQKTPGKERIRIHWSEPSAIQVNEFPSAQQIIVKIPEAALAGSGLNTLDTSKSAVLNGAKIQPITLSDGREGIQATFNLREWTKPTAIAGPRWLTITYDAPNAPAAEAITLSNDDIEALDAKSFGSAHAPQDGAGQAPGAEEPFAAFYVPPDLTQEEKEAQVSNTDVGMMNTMNLFQRTVNLDYKDADLQNVIRSIATKLKLNIILMPGDVSGRVTVSLNNVRLGDAFDSLLKANNLAYKVEEGGIVRIVPRDEVKSRDVETTTQSISINWVDAKEIVGVLKPFLSDAGQIQSHEQSNLVIVEDVPEKVVEVQELIRRLDAPEKQVRMEVRMVDMTTTARRALGFQNNFTSRAQKDLYPFPGTTGTIPTLITDTEKTITLPDGSTITETGKKIEPDFDSLLLYPTTVGQAGGAVAAAGGLDMAHRFSASILGTSFDIDARLTALENHDEAITLANPSVVSLNNIAASIEIKRQIPYLDATTSTGGSFATVKFADVGTKVELTPRITNNGYIIMDISPEQKIQVGTQNLSTTEVPIIDERFTETSVIAKDEQTIVLGGLRQFESTNSELGVPWFMRIPVLSWLAKTNTNQHRKLELYLFVTPHIVKDPEPSVYETAIYDKIDYNWDLPDYYFDEVTLRKSPNERVHPKFKPMPTDVK